MFALVDCNSCYASCEQIFRPDLRGKPVVVLSNNDGCIVARSKEAKQLGIPGLQAFFKIERLLRQKNVHIFSSNYTLYGDISQRVMNTLKNYSPDVEIYSIDEMFLCLDGIQDDLIEYGTHIKQTLWKDIRMPVSVGMAPTKTLAKMANHAAKKIDKTQGVCLLDSPHKWQWLQRRVEVKGLWGVGSRLAKRLNDLSIYTAYDLAQAETKFLRQQLSVNIERTIEELNGIAAFPLEDQPPAKRQIYCTRSFGEKPSTLQPLETAVSAYACRAAEKLRAQNHLCLTLQVFINTSPHEPNYYSRSQIIKLPYATDDSRLIVAAAKQALSLIFQPGKRYLKAGVGLLELTDKRFLQADLFTKAQSVKSDVLMSAVDAINNRYGQGNCYLASEGSGQRWHMRQQYKSPAYTTRWQDLPAIRCK